MFMLFVVPSINIDLLNQVSDKKMKLPLPRLETNGRVCFYGFAVTTEWLVDYAKAHWNNADRYDDFAKVSATIKLLRRGSHIKALQFEAALFRLIDARWFVSDSSGYLRGNRAKPFPGAAAVADDGDRTPLLFLCDAFPALSETFIASEAGALRELGHSIRIESSERPVRPDREVSRRFAVTQLEDDGIGGTGAQKRHRTHPKAVTPCQHVRSQVFH